MLVTIFSDASHCYQHRVAGVACWVKSQRVAIGVVDSAPITEWQIDNAQQAEACGVVFGIKTAIRSGAARDGDVLLIQCDCVGVEKYLRGIKKGKAWGDVDDALSNWLRKVRVERKLSFRYKHVKGHVNPKTSTRHSVNVMCDRLARRRMREARANIKEVGDAGVA